MCRHFWLEITTFADIAAGLRAYLCRDCPARKSEPVQDGSTVARWTA